MKKIKAICLLSGGLDSATVLYWALRNRFDVVAFTLNYGQLHKKEIAFAKRLSTDLGIQHEIVRISMPWKGSALTDRTMPLPIKRSFKQMAKNIPTTYVPARNTIFLSFAASFAEAVGANTILIGANAIDYSGYPDCRPRYLNAMCRALQLGTKAGIEGHKINILAPLLRMSKKQIIRLGIKLKVPYEKTWSCYQGANLPCGKCDSCQLRANGFSQAGFQDPLLRL